MNRRYNHRLVPDEAQSAFLDKCCDADRYIWNQFLGATHRYYAHSKKFHYKNEMSKQLTEIKKIDGCEWLNLVPSTATQQAVIRLDKTLKEFNKKKVGFPQFKSKKAKQSFNLTKNNFSIKKGKLFISNFKEGIKVKWSRKMPVPSSVTIIKDKLGHYYASFVVDVPEPKAKVVTSEIALDLGIESFVTDNNGNKHKLPELKHLLIKVRTQQRALSRKKKGSKNREEARLRLAKTHNKIVNIRKDYVNKLVKKLVDENQVIIVENLDIPKMLKQASYARHIALQGWGILVKKLEVSCASHKRVFHKIDRYFPSSQICSSCNYKWGKLNTSIRQKVCSSCGVSHDRDINAAINILNEYRSTVGHTASLK